jgi:hypothetical protein
MAGRDAQAKRQTEAKPQAIGRKRLAVERTMKLMTYYIVLATIGDVVAVFICLAIEQVVPWISMPIFLTMFFLILWAAWVLAVRMTEPKSAPAGATSDQRA